MTFPLAALGADGIISVVANEVPAEFSQMVRYALKGNFARAREMHFRLLDLMNANFVESNPIPVKAAMAMMGLMEESYRLPLTPLGEKSRVKLEKALKQLKLVR